MEIFPKYAIIAFEACRGKFHYSRNGVIDECEIKNLLPAVESDIFASQGLVHELGYHSLWEIPFTPVNI